MLPTFLLKYKIQIQFLVFFRHTFFVLFRSRLRLDLKILKTKLF